MQWNDVRQLDRQRTHCARPRTLQRACAAIQFTSPLFSPLSMCEGDCSWRAASQANCY